MVNGGSWEPVTGGRKQNNKNKTGRFEGDRRGAVQRSVWDAARKQKRKGFVDSIRESSLSYFFTNLPDDANLVELRQVFSQAGEVVDVFIPAKVDKLGRHFGFVLFGNERDVARLERRILNIWVGTYKLQINRSHVPVSSMAGKGKQPVVMAAAEPVTTEKTVVNQNVKWGAWPKVGAWKNKPFGGNRKSFNMEYEVDGERVKMLTSCYVGILSDSRSATAVEFQHSLTLEGYHYIKVTPMGGDSVLLSSSVEGAIPEAINSNRQWWSAWLRGFSSWEPSLISSKRRVWLRCMGVPLNVWEEKLGLRYDVGRVRILTSYAEPIDEVVNLIINGEIFPISVVEERFGHIDGGVTIPPQRSAQLYSSGSDECSSGIGGSVGDFGGGYGCDGGSNGDDDLASWALSDARRKGAGDGISSLQILLPSDACAERKEKTLAFLERSVQQLSQASEIGCRFGESCSEIGGLKKVMEHEIGVMAKMDGSESVQIAGVGVLGVAEAQSSECDGVSRVSETFDGEREWVGPVGRVVCGAGLDVGSGLKLLISAQNNNNVAYTVFLDNDKNIGLPLASVQRGSPHKAHSPIIQHSSNSFGLGLDNEVALDSVSSGSSSPELNDVAPVCLQSSRQGVVPSGRVVCRKGRFRRGGKAGLARGSLPTAVFSTSHRIFSLARGVGRKSRGVPPAGGEVSNLGGIQLHVELPNLNDIPVGDIGELNDDNEEAEEVSRGVSLAGGSDGSTDHESLSAAGRLLAIGRRIGVTFRCGEDTMIEKFAQLEERDKRDKEERFMRNNGHQCSCVR